MFLPCQAPIKLFFNLTIFFPPLGFPEACMLVFGSDASACDSPDQHVCLTIMVSSPEPGSLWLDS